ncbi:MAG: hypothetical protein J0M12_01585 [Deltaproteobacteria bacterium]|nr:hypothetical protein [Deltaproteobacteria bacterium]
MSTEPALSNQIDAPIPAPVTDVLIGASFESLKYGAPFGNSKLALQRLVSHLGSWVGISEDLQHGIYTYLLKNRLVSCSSDAQSATEFLIEAAPIFRDVTLQKARGFTYLIDRDESTATTLSAALQNARFLFRTFSPEFFSCIKKYPLTIDTLEAPIGNSDYFLTLRGTSGAGTVSLDFVINAANPMNRHQLHPLWKMGLDTKLTTRGLEGRVIRSGSMIGKPSLQDSSLDHRAAFGAFRDTFRISPQRALGCLLVFTAGALGCESVRALTDEGAFQLSTLRSPQSGAHYGKLFRGLGFQEGHDACWSHLPPTGALGIEVVPNGSSTPGLQRYERHGLKEVLRAAIGLQSKFTGREFKSSVDLSEPLRILEQL